MAATRSTLEGVAALTKQLIALGKLDDGKALKMAVRAGIKETLKAAQAIAPVGTVPHRTYRGLLVAPGFSKSQLKIISTINSAKNIASGILSVSKQAYYVLQYWELGTRKQPAHPFLRQALSNARGNSESALRSSLERAVDRAAKTR
ncbi:MAG TPA: HK97-gp10 family putative phage morphogenesis protein [Gemmatimonadaceae bacterium]|nr:HK97-gp10 family putative phage morphogenesis protein [Gemmatimonadaceae bacterium]